MNHSLHVKINVQLSHPIDHCTNRLFFMPCVWWVVATVCGKHCLAMLSMRNRRIEACPSLPSGLQAGRLAVHTRDELVKVRPPPQPPSLPPAYLSAVHTTATAGRHSE
mmetsp:Transcript_44890/g.126775  ORF Transcript_44890/g.126775 Transcript_44890/m.126775 type:complete len:108 (+) Transcript_44890:2378-2701(+)